MQGNQNTTFLLFCPIVVSSTYKQSVCHYLHCCCNYDMLPDSCVSWRKCEMNTCLLHESCVSSILAVYNSMHWVYVIITYWTSYVTVKALFMRSDITLAMCSIWVTNGQLTYCIHSDWFLREKMCEIGIRTYINQLNLDAWVLKKSRAQLFKA